MRSVRTSHPTAWFGFGVFAGWAAAMSIGTIQDTTPGRWNSEAGLAAGQFGAALIAVVMATIFAAWLAVRRRGRPVGPRSEAPLLMGLVHPWLCVGVPLAMERLTGAQAAAGFTAMVILFASPLLFAEAVIRRS